MIYIFGYPVCECFQCRFGMCFDNIIILYHKMFVLCHFVITMLKLNRFISVISHLEPKTLSIYIPKPSGIDGKDVLPCWRFNDHAKKFI